MEHLAEDTLIADRLNQEPVVLLGYTNSELIWAVKAACLVAFPLALLLGLLIGKAMALFGSGMLIAAGLIYLGGKKLQRYKRGKPDFYYQVKMNLLLEQYHLGTSGLFRHHGTMDLGRRHYPRKRTNYVNTLP
jgi:conjugative transfer region protein (TIGR03750 family)